MSVENPPPAPLHDVPGPIRPPSSTHEIASKNEVVSALLITLIAGAAWFFFTNLFPRHARTPTPAAPVATAQETAPVFVPTGLPAPAPVISLPTVETENEADKTQTALDSAAQQPPENSVPPIIPEHPTAKHAKRIRLPLASNSARRPAAHVRMPRVEPRMAAIHPSLLPHAPESQPSVIPENSAGSLPISGTENSRLDNSNSLRESNSASVSEPGTTIINYSGYSPDPESAPVDFASISTVAPTPKPPTATPVRRPSGLVVIVNKANSKSFSRSDISNIYRDRITRWPSGARILVLNLPLDSTERQRFSTAILEMSPLDAATEGSNRTITNRLQNEYRTKNAQVVVSYIEHHENAIGYIPAAALTENDNVRVVYSIP